MKSKTHFSHQYNEFLSDFWSVRLIKKNLIISICNGYRSMETIFFHRNESVVGNNYFDVFKIKVSFADHIGQSTTWVVQPIIWIAFYCDSLDKSKNFQMIPIIILIKERVYTIWIIKFMKTRITCYLLGIDQWWFLQKQSFASNIYQSLIELSPWRVMIMG